MTAVDAALIRRGDFIGVVVADADADEDVVAARRGDLIGVDVADEDVVVALRGDLIGVVDVGDEDVVVVKRGDFPGVDGVVKVCMMCVLFFSKKAVVVVCRKARTISSLPSLSVCVCCENKKRISMLLSLSLLFLFSL